MDSGMTGCPHCEADLRQSIHRDKNRTDGEAGGKSLGHELVTCPECGGVIDGFTAH